MSSASFHQLLAQILHCSLTKETFLAQINVHAQDKLCMKPSAMPKDVEHFCKCVAS